MLMKVFQIVALQLECMYGKSARYDCKYANRSRNRVQCISDNTFPERSTGVQSLFLGPMTLMRSIEGLFIQLKEEEENVMQDLQFFYLAQCVPSNAHKTTCHGNFAMHCHSSAKNLISGTQFFHSESQHWDIFPANPITFNWRLK